MSRKSLIDAVSRLWPDQDASGFNYFDFLHARGSPQQALFYSGLFCPQFMEFDGMVFLEETIEDPSDQQRVREALRRYDGDQVRTEQSFNTVELPSLFGGRAMETTDEEDEILASQICATWRARLGELFPMRAFSVEVVPADGTGEIAVRFYQRPPRFQPRSP
jgi:hypothetical protein